MGVPHGLSMKKCSKNIFEPVSIFLIQCIHHLNLLFSARYFVIDGEFIIDGPRPGDRAVGYKVITPSQFVLFRDCPAFASFILGDVLLAKHYLARLRDVREDELRSVTDAEICYVNERFLSMPRNCRYVEEPVRVIALDVRFERANDKPSVNRRFLRPIPKPIYDQIRNQFLSGFAHGTVDLTSTSLESEFDRICSALDPQPRGRGTHRVLHCFDQQCDCRV